MLKYVKHLWINVTNLGLVHLLITSRGSNVNSLCAKVQSIKNTRLYMKFWLKPDGCKDNGKC